jgi:hypothetical protein
MADSRLDPTVRVLLTVGDLVLPILANSDTLFSTSWRVFFASSDCSGVGFAETFGSPGLLFGTAAITGSGPSGETLLHVIDAGAPPVTITALSYRQQWTNGCGLSDAPQEWFWLQPVLTTVDITYLGPPPYRVIRTP